MKLFYILIFFSTVIFLLYMTIDLPSLKNTSESVKSNSSITPPGEHELGHITPGFPNNLEIPRESHFDQNHSRQSQANQQKIQSIIRERQNIIEKEFGSNLYRSNLPGNTNRRRPYHNLIVTSWRSGSTFVGEVLRRSQPESTYYHYEPLHLYGFVQFSDREQAMTSLSLLKDLLLCNYSSHPEYLMHAEKKSVLFYANKLLWEVCENKSDVCYKAEFLQPYCQLFPIHTMKVVRVRLKLFKELMDDPRLNLKIIYLVRDPRGSMQSRRQVPFCKGESVCEDPFILCNDVTSDHHAAKSMIKEYPHRIRILRYEDFSMDAYNQSEQLLKFFDMEYSPNVQLYLDDCHKENRFSDMYSTFKDPRTTAFEWRFKMGFKAIENIQNACKVPLQLFGYNELTENENIKDFNPLGQFNL